jgi:hydroxymethylbilane synthase
MTRDLIAQAHGMEPDEIAIKVISTGGDRSQSCNAPLSEIGGKGQFSKEIEDRLISGEIDLGVHSTKDMATSLPQGLTMDVFLPREDIRDALMSRGGIRFDDLREGAVLGTSSIRRAAQLLRERPDLKRIEFRGNVATRMRKLDDGVADATLLALAGLKRLGMERSATEILDPERFLPAPAQGAIGLEIREDDTRLADLIGPLNHHETHQAVTAERRFLAGLDGSCRTPIGALTKRDGGELTLIGEILSLDGAERFRALTSGPAEDAAEIGADVARQLRKLAGQAFFDALDLRG